MRGLVLDSQTGKPIAGAVVGFSRGLNDGAPYETTISDANGRYSLLQPPWRVNDADYDFVVNGARVGFGYPLATNYRADLVIDRAQCISRYGVVLDAGTHRPIRDAVVRDGNVVAATTDKEGWYQLTWGCGVLQLGSGTRFSVMSHRDYESQNFAFGRGISGFYREDVLLHRK